MILEKVIIDKVLRVISKKLKNKKESENIRRLENDIRNLRRKVKNLEQKITEEFVTCRGKKVNIKEL